MKMFTLMKQLNNRQKFQEEINESRDLEVKRTQTSDYRPVFNKRLFSAHNFVFITSEVHRRTQ